jgi:hypothetical protein
LAVTKLWHAVAALASIFIVEHVHWTCPAKARLSSPPACLCAPRAPADSTCCIAFETGVFGNSCHAGAVAFSSSVGPCVTQQDCVLLLLLRLISAVTDDSFVTLSIAVVSTLRTTEFEALVTLVYVTLDPPRFDVRLSTDESSLFFVEAAHAL